MSVNGKRVEIWISGLEHNQTNKPVIVFENGRGSTFNSWEKVINEISKNLQYLPITDLELGNRKMIVFHHQ